MTLVTPLAESYNAISDDARINSTHISVYMALLQQWNLHGGENPLKIERGLIMKAAKINARHTCNKCINCLHEYGYIKYSPSINGSVSSTVILNYCKNEK